MNTSDLIKNLRKISYIATIRKLKVQEINTIKIAIHRLENYKISIKEFIKAK